MTRRRLRNMEVLIRHEASIWRTTTVPMEGFEISLGISFTFPASVSGSYLAAILELLIHELSNKEFEAFRNKVESVTGSVYQWHQHFAPVLSVKGMLGAAPALG